MAGLRGIFANNLKKNRRNKGLSQEKLAEKAAISTHYVAMLELTHNFPSSEILERLAAALNIEVYELFLVSPSVKDELNRLHQTIVNEIKQTVAEAVEDAFEKRETKND